MSAPVQVGIIGCGVISDTYIRNCSRFPELRIVGLADIDISRAQAKALEYGIPFWGTAGELLSQPQIEVIVNLTVPNAHLEVSLAALRAGKSVYSEKPITATRDEGKRLVSEATDRGLRLACAPDTFLGSGLRTCRKVIDDGEIGRVIGATAFRLNHGMEHWHANPAFFYQPGAGPLFDIGPYYLTALVSMLGPVASVAGTATMATQVRKITSGLAQGGFIEVGTPTHVSSLLSFRSGAVASTINSFDVWESDLPRIEIYGTEGTLSVPDPNSYGGPVRIRTASDTTWRDVPLLPEFAGNLRGAGLLDLVLAIRDGRPHRASAEMAFHVLDVMQSILESAERNEFVAVASSCERPEALPA